MSKTKVYYEIDSWTHEGGSYILQKFLPKELGLIGGMLKDGMVVKAVRRIECDVETWQRIFE